MADGKTVYSLIYDIYEELNINADDTSFSQEWIIEKILDRRVQWINHVNNKNRDLDPVLIQVIPCVELTEVDVAECCDVVTGCYIKRTLNRVPNAIQLHHKKLYTQVSGVGIDAKPENIITYINRDRAKWWGNSVYNTKEIATFWLNGYLYFIARDNFYLSVLEKVRVEMVAENPIDLAESLDCSGKPCWTWDSEFPISRQMWTWMKEDILKDMRNKLSLSEDDREDNKDNNIPDNNNP